MNPDYQTNMGVLELPLIIAGWFLTAGLAGVGGAFAIQGKNNTRLEKYKMFTDQRIERVIRDNEERINFFIDNNKKEHKSVLEHLQNMEKFLYDIRAELPEKYTLKSDHLRLSDKVEELTIELFRHREILLGSGGPKS